MVKTKEVIINGIEYTKSYSDEGMFISRNGQTYFEAIDPVGFQREYEETENASNEKTPFEEYLEVAETVENLGGLSYKTVPSDKLGYDFYETYVGDVLVKQEYVKNENATGTADDPIEYYDGVALINNAFYMKDGVRVVYMDGQFVEF